VSKYIIIYNIEILYIFYIKIYNKYKIYNNKIVQQKIEKKIQSLLLHSNRIRNVAIFSSNITECQTEFC